MKLNQSLNKTRFDLEEAIMNLWSSDQDVDTLFKYYYDRQGEVDVEEVANALLGIKQLIHMRGMLAFELFEKLIKEKQL
jgi:hypothetical protein